jgi:hypothetical protein
MGAGYRVWDSGAGAAADHAKILSGGAQGNFLRLSNAVNSQNANIGFDQTVPDGAQKDFIEAKMDFRMSGDAGGHRADGFGFGLFNTATYGSSGTLVESDQTWESAALGGALILGVRIYDGDAGTNTDYLRLTYDGVEYGFLTFAEFNLNSDQWHQLKLNVVNNGTESLVSVSMIPDIQGVPGAPVSVFNNIPIPLDVDEFNFRAGVGIRTGGLNMDADFDNLQVNVPEPTAAGLLLLGGLLMTKRRRNR